MDPHAHDPADAAYPPPAARVPACLPATRTRLQMRRAMRLEERQLTGWFSNRRLQEKARAMGVPAGQLRARAMRAAYTKQKVPARTRDAPDADPHQHMLTTSQPMLTCECRLRPPQEVERQAQTASTDERADV